MLRYPEAVARFVASLRIPDDRKALLHAEFIDHLHCVAEAEQTVGGDPEAAALAALASLQELRPQLEAIEPAFAQTPRGAFLRGVVISLILVACGDALWWQWWQPLPFGMELTLLVAIAWAGRPAGFGALLSAELRARRAPGSFLPLGGTRVGPALTYLFAATHLPLLWLSAQLLAQTLLLGDNAPVTPVAPLFLQPIAYLAVAAELVRGRLRWQRAG